MSNEEFFKRNHVNKDKNTGYYYLKIHCTFVNLLFLNKIEKKQGKNVSYKIYNAEEYISAMNDLIGLLEEFSIKCVHFSLMREDKESEKYICVKEFAFI